MAKVNWGKPFTVKVISREDLCALGFPRWQIASLTDSEMCKIADMMCVSYTDGFFSEDLHSATEFVLFLRAKPNIIGELV